MGVLPDKAKEEVMVGDAVAVVTVVGAAVCSISVWLASPQARRTTVTRRIVRLVAVSWAERNCTGRAEQNYTTERRGVSIKVSWYVRA